MMGDPPLAVEMTGFDAGISGDDQIRIVLQEIVHRGGAASMADHLCCRRKTHARAKALSPRKG
jgi:hypothetical protein